MTEGFVKLISVDGHEFFADEKILMQCDVLCRMLEQGNFQEGASKIISFKEDKYCNITGKLMEKVIEYLYFKHKYTDSVEPIPEFPIDDDVVLDLLPVANYLGLN